MKIPMKGLIVVLLAIIIGGIAAAGNDAPWQKHGQIWFSGDGQDSDGSAYWFTFQVSDYDLNSEGPYSSTFRGYTYSYADGGYLIYDCQEVNYRVEAVSRIPDNSSFIGPNKPWSYTINVPGCDENGVTIPAATFSIQCDANAVIHISRSGAYKQTNVDGTKLFFAEERDHVYAAYNANVDDTTCSATFENADVTLIDETADGWVVLSRFREK